MTKLKVNCDMVSPSGEWCPKRNNTDILELLRSASISAGRTPRS